MPFELKTSTAAKLTSVTPRIEKHGDSDVPAVSLGIKITGPNTLLDLLAPGLRDVLYMKPEGQEELPGIEFTTPLLRTRAVEKFKVKMADMAGWRVIVDHGIDDDSAIDLHDCKVDKFSVEPFEGGSIELAFRIGSSDVDSTYIGALAMKLGSEVQIQLHAPEKAADVIDGSMDAFRRDYPDLGDEDQDAGGLFAAAHGDPGGDDLSLDLDADANTGPGLAEERPAARRTRKATSEAVE